MMGLLANSLYTIHQGKVGGRGLSPRLWGKVSGQMLSPDGFANGFFAGDDFNSFGGTVTSTTGTYSGEAGSYKSYQDTSCTILQRADVQGGAIRLSLAGTDNNEANLKGGYDAGNLGQLSRTAGSNFLTAFETRIRVGQVSNTYDFFVGLGVESFAITQAQIDAGGAMADLGFIGFRVDEAAGGTLTFTYKKNGQTVQKPITSLATLTAGTWIKLGFIYDPTADNSKKIKIFVDNVEQSTYVTDANMAAATWPDAVYMNFLAALKNASAATKYAEIDWWAYFQAGQ